MTDSDSLGPDGCLDGVPPLPGALASLPYFTAEELLSAFVRRGAHLTRNGTRALLGRMLDAGTVRQIDRGLFTARGCRPGAPAAPFAVGRRFRPRPEAAHVALSDCCRRALEGRAFSLLDSDWLAPFGLGPPAGRSVVLLEAAREDAEALRSLLRDRSLSPLREAFPGHKLVVRPLPSHAPFDTARGVDHPCLERLVVDAFADMACRNAEVYGPLEVRDYDAFLRRTFAGYGVGLRRAVRCARSRRLGAEWASRLLACEGLDLYCREERADLPVLYLLDSAMRRSISSGSFGIVGDRSTPPSSVTSMSSSMRMPMPHSGT